MRHFLLSIFVVELPGKWLSGGIKAKSHNDLYYMLRFKGANMKAGV